MSIKADPYRDYESTERTRLTLNHPDSKPPTLPRASLTPTWVRIAAGVGGVATLTFFVVASQVWKGDLNDNPAINVAVCGAAGTLARVTVKVVCSDHLDASIAQFLTGFGFHIFQAFNLVEAACEYACVQKYPAGSSELDKCLLTQRQIWFPLIFTFGAYPIADLVVRKLTATQATEPNNSSQIEMRPLPIGDTNGSIWPFVIRGALWSAVGVGTAIASGFGKNYTIWRIGLVATGVGIGLPFSQLVYKFLREVKSEYLDSGTRDGTPLSQKVLTIFGDLAQAVGKMGVSAVCAGILLIPEASQNVLDDVSWKPLLKMIGLNILAGLPAALIDVAKQHAFQHPRTINGGSFKDRFFQAIKSKEMAGTVLVIGGLAGWIWYNNRVPTPGSVPAACILLGGTTASLGITSIIRAVCPAGQNKWRNFAHFRGAFSTHLVGLGFMVMTSNYYFDLISPDDNGSYYVLMGLTAWLLGNTLTELFQDNRDINFLLLLVLGMTITGYAKGLL